TRFSEQQASTTSPRAGMRFRPCARSFLHQTPTEDNPMSTHTSNNGRVRKTLASQLDRLETILDTLGDNLPDAISSAVERSVGMAVKEAVQAVVVELISNPALQEQLQTASTPVLTAQ